MHFVRCMGQTLMHRTATSSLNDEAKRLSDPQNQFKSTKWSVNIYALSVNSTQHLSV